MRRAAAPFFRPIAVPVVPARVSARVSAGLPARVFAGFPVRIYALLPALVLVALLAPAAAHAQANATAHPTILSVPPADPADVESIESIVAALYDVISGPVGEPRDWNRMRSLFAPGGRLMPTAPRPGGATGLRFMEVNDYIALSGATLEARGFREHEIARRVERFGDIAHVFSTYEGFQGDETEPFLRGINSIQLLDDGSRWWILSVYWQAESPDNPLPGRYLPGGDAGAGA
jgi:hypothetical protein